MTRAQKPVFSVNAPLPGPSRKDLSYVYAETCATLWMWTWPELIGWPRPITWLFSMVTGNKRRPGDVWGIDSAGELIMVEAKTCHERSRSHDPFADFIIAGCSVLEQDCELTQAANLGHHWRTQMAHERAFMGEDLAVLLQSRPKRPYPGVVPYSSRRRAVRIWRDVYEQHLAPRLRSAEYAAEVERNLRTRQKRGNPPPHFVALFASNGGTAKWSSEGKANRAALAERVEDSHVHVVAVAATPRSEFVQITSRRL